MNGRARPDGRCHYCPRPGETWDHVVPRSVGGVDRTWNLVPACPRCNSAKKNRMPWCRCARCLWALFRWERGDRQPLPAERRRLKRERRERRRLARLEAEKTPSLSPLM